MQELNEGPNNLLASGHYIGREKYQSVWQPIAVSVKQESSFLQADI